MMLPHFRSFTPQGLRWSKAFPLTASAAMALWLGGCAAPGSQFQSTGVDPLPAQYQDFFDGEQPRNPEWMHDNALDKAEQLVAAGQTREAILELKAVAAQDIPKAYYELGKIWDQGKGIQADPAKAATYYEDAVRTPSYILGHASLNLAKLSLEQEGAPYRPVLAYYLLEQAMEEQIGRDEGVVMASLLARGADGVAADPQRALALYRQAADTGNADATLALAQAYAEGGWLDNDPERSRQYAQRYAEGLRERAGGGDVKAMTELAELYAADGLLAGNDEQRLHWLSQAAQAGDPGAVAKAGRE
ncbi:MAG: tetratricopeptide repeat protein, partial [Pseudomonadota bacterium]|nr:tetratricopeptide repeat protein [Pseudomonadota bacterium]